MHALLTTPQDDLRAPSAASAATRLYFLDWLRIAAFFLLIAFHVGMYYVSWDWHVKSPHASGAPEPFMLLLSPWRLSLLFLVSGVASALLLAKMPLRRFAGQRSRRLLLPLAFGMLVIVPPQAYLEVVEKFGYAGGYGDFMRLYLSAYAGFCRDGRCLVLPTWNHLWFVAYLWVYTMLLCGACRLFARHGQAVSAWVRRHLEGWRMLVLPAACLGAMRVMLLDAFPETHALFDDWYNHTHYLALFLLGALLARHAGFWDALAVQRRHALLIALVGWACLVAYFGHYGEARMPPDWLRALQRMVHAAVEWNAIIAACGFARRYLNHDNAARRYLTQAVFPVYILHQTLIVIFAHALKPAELEAWPEASLLFAATLACSFAVFEAVRRVPLLRPWFGLGRG